MSADNIDPIHPLQAFLTGDEDLESHTAQVTKIIDKVNKLLVKGLHDNLYVSVDIEPGTKKNVVAEVIYKFRKVGWNVIYRSYDGNYYSLCVGILP